MKRRLLYGIWYVLALVAFVACSYALTTVLSLEKRLSNGLYESVTEKGFYSLPEDIPVAKAGTLFRSEKLASAPNGMVGWRILYYSTDVDGKSIIVSGLVVASSEPSSVKRDVVSWAHPTTGVAQRCAPSVGIDPFDSIEGLRDLVKAGYVVAATDYSGMGVAGPASFLIGKTEGQNVLDAAKAAQQLPAANANSNVILWGHSQGGHAALFAEQIASSYAPHIHIKGVAVAAPATELAQLLEANIDSISSVTIGSYVVQSYASAYNADITTILSDEAARATPTIASYCLLGQNKQIKKIAQPFIGSYFAENPSTKEPWKSLLAENTPGKNKVQAPLFIAQGEKDTLIHPSVTQDFANTQKQLGTSVTYESYPNATHAVIALDAMPAVLIWLTQLPN